LFWAFFSGVDSCGDVLVCRDGNGEWFEFYLGGLAFAWCVAHGGFDIDDAEGVGLCFDEAASDGCAWLDVEVCGADAALDVG